MKRGVTDRRGLSDKVLRVEIIQLYYDIPIAEYGEK